MTRMPPRPSRRTLLRALAAASLRAAAPLLLAASLVGSHALASEPALAQFDLSRDEDGVFLDYAVDFDLGRNAEEALMKSVPIFFVAEAEMYRDRWYWRDRRVGHATRVWKIVYQPLTSNYRVSAIGGLSQNYATRAEAITAISRASRWKIAEPGQVEEGARHYVDFNFRLDTNLLPRPMQIGVSGQPDWQLSVKRTQRIN